MTLVSIREYYLRDGKQLPTTQGISLSSEQWSTFKNSVPAIEEAITKLEGRIRSGHNGSQNGEISSSVVDIQPVPIDIVCFDGKNYQRWAKQIKLLLKQLKINYVLNRPRPNATLWEKDAGAGGIVETKNSKKRWVYDMI